MSKDTFVLKYGQTYWYRISDEQLAELAKEDARIGNTMDSAGEPRIYSHIRSARVQEDTFATILRRRNVPWNCYRTKPSRLVEGLINVDGVPRVVMFQIPKAAARKD